MMFSTTTSTITPIQLKLATVRRYFTIIKQQPELQRQIENDKDSRRQILQQCLMEEMATTTTTTTNTNEEELCGLVIKILIDDIMGILDLRDDELGDNKGTSLSIDSFKRWFGNDDELIPHAEIILSWIDVERDFIFSLIGQRVLKRRYLLGEREPIQYFMLRVAKLFSREPITRLQQSDYPQSHHNRLQRALENYNSSSSKVEAVTEPTTTTTPLTVLNLNLLRLMYDMLSCGYLHVSSTLAAAEEAHTGHIQRGEACHLMVTRTGYDKDVIVQVEQICTKISLGVGMGLSVDSVPLQGNPNGGIRSGFREFAHKLDSCNALTLHERYPKISLSYPIHSDIVYTTIDLKRPNKQPLENVFFAAMINDYFMECVRNDRPWYLFANDLQLPGLPRLVDCNEDTFEEVYAQYVSSGRFTYRTTAKDLLTKLIDSFKETGSPYLIWDTNVNRYSNQQHLGRTKTLNLCAEITNYADSGNSASCTLISVNMGAHREFPQVMQRIQEYCLTEINDTFRGLIATKQFESKRSPKLARYAYTVGYFGTLALNNFLSDNARHSNDLNLLRRTMRREIGLNPLGIYDSSILIEGDDDLQHNPIDASRTVSEVMYMGAIESSCDYTQWYDIECRYYRNSYFERGVPQWQLRQLPTRYNDGKYNYVDTKTIDWNATQKRMHGGMANSMLTSQAPTATTALLMGVTESATVPLNIVTSKESYNGRIVGIAYGIQYALLNGIPFKLWNSIEQQLDMYTASLPFVDHSQSTMFFVPFERQKIFDLIKETYLRRFKTGIYYLIPPQRNETLQLVKNQTTTTTNKTESSSSSSSSSCSRFGGNCEGCSL